MPNDIDIYEGYIGKHYCWFSWHNPLCNDEKCNYPKANSLAWWFQLEVRDYVFLTILGFDVVVTGKYE